MIRRDPDGIICQHDPNNPSYLDGGDSSSRTGLMAMCGSAIDQELMPKFFVPDKDGLLSPVRHPGGPLPFSLPEAFSRDQLLCFASGVGGNSLARIRFSNWIRNRKNTCWINSDILLPHHVAHLYICADIKLSKFMLWFSAVLLYFNLLYNCFVTPWAEQNQLIAMLVIKGPGWVKFYLRCHPDCRRALVDYWGSWRDQIEIGLLVYDKLTGSVTPVLRSTE